jgi:hypothetical protein
MDDIMLDNNYLHFIYGFFNDTVSSSPIKWQAISPNELEKMWMEIIMARFGLVQKLQKSSGRIVNSLAKI